MKKLLFAALLSLAGVGLSTGQASAWLFCHHCCSGSATLCVKPYNAFSPSCFGSITCDGCFPMQFGNHGAYPPGGGPGCGGPGCYGPSLGCAMDGGCCAPGMPGMAPMAAPHAGAPTMLPPGAGTAPVFQAPMPNAPTTGAVAWPSPVQAVGYYPGYAPMPWMPPPTYPTYWNMNNPYGR